MLRLSAAFEIISAALIRGRRSLKKFDLKCGAHSRAGHSRAALNRGRRSIGGGAQTSKYGIVAQNLFKIEKKFQKHQNARV